MAISAPGWCDGHIAFFRVHGLRDFRMAFLRDIVIDSVRPSAVAHFWAEALEDYQVAAYDDAELERLQHMGITDIADDPSVLVEPVTGDGPRFSFQLVPETKAVKNRLHLDLAVTDVQAEVIRLVDLGARVLTEYTDHLLLADTDGNEFCILRPTLCD
jgi:glyoxalase superfamily protein